MSPTEFHHNSIRPNQPESAKSAVLTHHSNFTSVSTLASRPFDYEVLTSAELAQRLKVKELGSGSEQAVSYS